MALYLFLSLLIIVLLILTLLQYLNTNRIVDQQLTQHKMMFPNQIRRSRSVYMRGIFRANHRQRNLRTTAIVSDILAAICLVNAIVVHFQPDSTVSLGNSLLRDQALHVSSQLNTTIQNTSLLIGMLLALVSRIAWLYLARWRYQKLVKADSEHASGPTDLFWTPTALLRNQYHLQLGIQAVLIVGVIFLALTGLFDWLPTPNNATSQPQSQSVPTSPSSSRTSAPSVNTESNTSNASSGSTPHTTQPTYPIDDMKNAPLAPAAALANLTAADRSALLFTMYWTMNGLQTYQVAEYANSTDETYSYHLVSGASGQLIVFSETIPSVNQSDYMFYAFIQGETVKLYNMYQSKQTITSLASQYNLTVTGTTITPNMPEIQDSNINMRQLISAFLTDPAFAKIKSGLTQGAAVPL